MPRFCCCCIYVISLVAYTGNFELEYWCMKNGFKYNEKKKNGGVLWVMPIVFIQLH